MSELYHPYRNLTGGAWISGNLHAHTTNSDGERSQQDVIDSYARLGHGFLMISDHDTYTSDQELETLDSKGMILISGNEITANGPHLLHVGASSLVHLHENRQEVIDPFLRQKLRNDRFLVNGHIIDPSVRPVKARVQPFDQRRVDGDIDRLCDESPCFIVDARGWTRRWRRGRTCS